MHDGGPRGDLPPEELVDTRAMVVEPRLAFDQAWLEPHDLRSASRVSISRFDTTDGLAY